MKTLLTFSTYIPAQMEGTNAIVAGLGMLLTVITFWFAFNAKRENMWLGCAMVGIIAGVLGASYNWTLMHSSLGYAPFAHTTRLMSMILGIILSVLKALAICGFGWICRWLFIWRKQKNHPGVY